MIRFREVLRCSGVDEVDPAGMVIKFKGSNLVAVDTDGQAVKLVETSNAMSIKDADETAVKKSMTDAAVAAKPNTDPLYVKSYMPATDLRKPKFYRINGEREIGEHGAKVSLMVRGAAVKTLRVLVLKELVVTIAIRALYTADASGKPVMHAKRGVLPGQEVNVMNAIWTPQTQIRFKLVDWSDAFINDSDPKVRAKIAKALGLRDEGNAKLGEYIDTGALAPLFAEYKSPGADVTIFVVDKIWSTTPPAGRTESEWGMIFIASQHFPPTFAHEMGHALGAGYVDGNWRRFVHTYNVEPGTSETEDTRYLMRDGGAGYKIPFKYVEKFRSFKANQTKKASR